LFVAGEGYSRKVDFEKFGVALAVLWGVEGGVDVIEDVFGREVGLTPLPPLVRGVRFLEVPLFKGDLGGSVKNSKPSFWESSLINSGARFGRRPFGELVGSVSNRVGVLVG